MANKQEDYRKTLANAVEADPQLKPFVSELDFPHFIVLFSLYILLPSPILDRIILVFLLHFSTCLVPSCTLLHFLNTCVFGCFSPLYNILVSLVTF
ncbi:hypothetical protein DL89DRAFT_71906 [Linderina pennispora]|uniref:Uncharacterized protein n=1 Tax=Linderina pennispora TaxID=61395 RepID=A0A1Y1VYJ5_9FUNG|nr:uncharacterized protein DL89DRAFT_71906 [Linderina pennispora]ORX66105.1 hypothetical protein DL89DRAFT_71906 [Linderina pennispora]